jgi:hypothetical protein
MSGLVRCGEVWCDIIYVQHVSTETKRNKLAARTKRSKNNQSINRASSFSSNQIINSYQIIITLSTHHLTSITCTVTLSCEPRRAASSHKFWAKYLKSDLWHSLMINTHTHDEHDRHITHMMNMMDTFTHTTHTHTPYYTTT